MRPWQGCGCILLTEEWKLGPIIQSPSSSWLGLLIFLTHEKDTQPCLKIPKDSGWPSLETCSPCVLHSSAEHLGEVFLRRILQHLVMVRPTKVRVEVDPDEGIKWKSRNSFVRKTMQDSCCLCDTQQLMEICRNAWLITQPILIACLMWFYLYLGTGEVRSHFSFISLHTPLSSHASW